MEIIQNVLKRKDSMAECYQRASERVCVTSSLFGQRTASFFFLMVICNSLLLLKSLPINIINCIKFYVNCSALTGVYDWQYKYLFVCLYANHLPWYNTKRYIQMVIFSTHYSTMEHLTTDNYLKSIYRLFQRTANTRCSLKHLNFKYNCT